jgi:hypothetical protein
MSCRLLHMIEQPDPCAYDDPDLKDLIGSFPRFFCTAATPPSALAPSESVRCLAREEPCWDPARMRPATAFTSRQV